MNSFVGWLNPHIVMGFLHAPKMHMFYSQKPVPQNVPFFGHRTFKDVIKLKWDLAGRVLTQ